MWIILSLTWWHGCKVWSLDYNNTPFYNAMVNAFDWVQLFLIICLMICKFSSTDSKYCRDAVFSLTTDYNNGALQCQCNGDGSLSYTCSEFGGQCRCKPNIIGRTCSSCKTGFYGFPNCRREFLILSRMIGLLRCCYMHAACSEVLTSAQCTSISFNYFGAGKVCKYF